MHPLMTRILIADNTLVLDEEMNEYLDSIGELKNSRSETYAETASRLGGNEFLEAAEKRWYELDS